MKFDRYKLYGFIDSAYLADRKPADLTRALIDGGVDIIQVRAKEYNRAQKAKLAMAVIGVAFRYNVPVIVNDDIWAASETGADGVHLGQEDWAAIHQEKQENWFENIRVLGLSTHSLEQATAAEKLARVNYIGVGPVFPTSTKPDAKPVGLELVKQVAGAVKVPFFAIGGITLENIDQVLAAGATRIAVVSAILNASDVAKAARKFKDKLG